MSKGSRCFMMFGITAGLLSVAQAGIVYQESVSGDFSGNGLSPTSISVALGSNQVFGTTGRDANAVVDRDYLTFTVPVGALWSGLLVLPGTTTLGNLGFIGLQAGNQVTVATNAVNAAGLLGYRHYNAADINTDILAEIGTAGNSSTGFTPPLGAGTYSLWIQETGTGTSNYGFDILLTAAPEPATYFTMLLALATFSFWRHKRSAAAK